MLSISQFAKICRTTVKTIRHYDNIGLLPADYISAETGYRYYRKRTAAKYYQILALKEAGFTLNDIKERFGSFDTDAGMACLDQQILLLKKQQEKCESIKKEYEKIMSESMKITVSKTANRITVSSAEHEEPVVINVESSIADKCAALLEQVLNEELIISFDLDDLNKMFSGKTAFAYGSCYSPTCKTEDFDELDIPRGENKATDLIVFFEASPDTSAEVIGSAIESFMMSFEGDVNILFSANAENSEKGLTLNWICFK